MSGLLFVILFAVVIIGVFFLTYLFRRRLMVESLNIRLLSVLLSQKFEKEEQRNENVLAEINKFAQFISSLANPKISFTLEVAVHNISESIHFYIAVPKKSTEFVSRQIQGLWPGAQVSPVEDYTIFNPEGVIELAYLRQARSQNIPIRTYEAAKLDTFAPILSNFSKLKEVGEGLALQVVIHPAPTLAKQNILNNIKTLKRGGEKESLLDVFKTQTKEKKEEREPKIIDEESIKVLEEKIAKPLFRVNARLIASAAKADEAKALLDGLSGSFFQFSAPRYNEFKVIKPYSRRQALFQFTFRQYKDAQGMLLNADEIASFFHFPTPAATEIPRVQWRRGKEAQPPLTLPEDGTLMGENVFRGERRPVYITDEDRRRHVYIIGQTGTGKTTLMKNMIFGDIQRGKGMSVIDPHGDLIADILTGIPKERAEDVVIFDPGDLERPVGLNMLENNPTRPEEKTFIVNEMQGIFNKLFSEETMGPMFEQYMRNALLLLMEDYTDPPTLMEVPRIFTDAEFRRRKLAKAKNPTVIDFWEKEAVKVGGEASLQNMTPYITSKFNNIIANDYVRPIISQPISTLNFRRIMDEGKILLVNLSKGRIGDINAGLLGMVIVGKILMAALSRVDLPQEARRDFNFFIDEFQNFTTDSISTILSEARKYRLNLVIVHQFIGQLEEKIRDSVFGNVGSMIAFRIGAEDAEVLVKQFTPVYSETDLINLDNFNAYIKLLINGQTTAPFNIQIPRPAPGDPSLGTRIRELSRLVYGRDRHEVEAETLRRLRT